MLILFSCWDGLGGYRRDEFVALVGLKSAWLCGIYSFWRMISTLCPKV